LTARIIDLLILVMLAVWLLVFLLISINALYVLAEFGAVATRSSRMKQLADEGSQSARRVLPVLEDPRLLDRYIAACQIGITLSSLVLGAYGQFRLTPELAALLENQLGLQPLAALSSAALVVLIGLSAMQMVLGELLPKSVALQYPARTALYTSYPMVVSLRLFSGLTKVLNGSALLLLRAFRLPVVRTRHIHSPDELELLIAESRDGGLLNSEEYRRLYRALQLGKRTVRQLMVPRPYIQSVDLNAPMEEIVSAVSNSPYTRLPVHHGSLDKVAGLLHAKNLVQHFLREERVESVISLLLPIVFVPESLTADRLFAQLRHSRTHLVLVVNEHGDVTGLVTWQDVLFEILGGRGYGFMGAHTIEHLSDGRVRLPGFMRLYEARPWIGRSWEGEAETVGGHIVETLGRLPEPGERVVIDGIPVEVQEVQNNAIRSLIITQTAVGDLPDE
jgi:putative hemolysin